MSGRCILRILHEPSLIESRPMHVPADGGCRVRRQDARAAVSDGYDEWETCLYVMGAAGPVAGGRANASEG